MESKSVVTGQALDELHYISEVFAAAAHVGRAAQFRTAGTADSWACGSLTTRRGHAAHGDHEPAFSATQETWETVEVMPTQLLSVSQVVGFLSCSRGHVYRLFPDEGVAGTGVAVPG
jgi:hypothetical protein